MRKTRTCQGGAAFLIAVALIAGCGDDDDTPDASSSGAAANGAPIPIGFTNTENSPAGSYPDFRIGAEAAVKYINNDLGGVNGRPLDMETCINNSSGESSISCANQFVQGGKVAVSYGYDFGSAGGWPVYTRAGIPVVGGIATEPVQLTSPNSFSFIGGTSGAIPALSRYIGETLKAKSVSILGIDIPAARLSIDNFAKPVLTATGVNQIIDVFESPTAADWTPSLTKANETNPDAILVLSSGATCAKIMQSAIALSIDPKKMVYPQNCLGTDTLDAGGAGAEGISANSPFLAPQSDDVEVKIFRDAMEKHASGSNIGPDTQMGFSQIMDLYAIMKKIPGEITPNAIMTALQATSDEPNFMAHPYTCNGSQVPGLPAICNANERILKVESGQLVDVTNSWVEGVSKLGG